MADNDMMVLEIEPELTVTPGNIAGPARGVDIAFIIVERANCEQLQVDYKILESTAYRFQEAGFEEFEAGIEYDVREGNSIASKLIMHPPQKGKCSQRLLLELKPDSAGDRDAALRIVASVQGVKGAAVLDAVEAVGPIAVLSGGLRMLSDKYNLPLESPLTLEGARKFVREIRPRLLNDPDYPNLRLPKTDETLVNLVMGITNSRASTLEGVEPVVKGFLERIRGELLAAHPNQRATKPA